MKDQDRLKLPFTTLEKVQIEPVVIEIPSGHLSAVQLRLTTRHGSKPSQTGPWLTLQTSQLPGLIQALGQALATAPVLPTSPDPDLKH